MHQVHIHHGHFIYDDGVRLQGIVPVFLEIREGAGRILLPVLFFVRAAPDAQQAVDGHGFPSGGLRHAAGRPARGGRQQDIQVLRLKIMDDRIDGGRFACAGTA